MAENIFVVPNKNIQKHSLMLIRLDAISDYIIFRNFIKLIKTSAKYKNYSITLLGNIAWKDLSVELDKNYIDKYIWIDRDEFNKNIDYRYNKIKEITSCGYEVIIHPTYSREFFIGDSIVNIVSAKEKIGSEGDLSNIEPWQKKIGDSYYTKLIPAKKEIMFEFYRNKEFFENIIETKLEIKKPHINLIPKELPFSLPKRYAVLCTGADSGFRKWWNAENFAKVGRYIKSKYAYEIVLCGEKEDIGDAKEFGNFFGMDFVNLVGKISLIDLLYVIHRGNMMIANESSAPHIAVAIGMADIFVIPNANHFGRFVPYPKEICENYREIYHPDVEGGSGLKPYSFVFKFGENFNKTNVFTHIEYNFGDNAIHMQYLRMLACKHKEVTFFHFAKKNYINDLKFYVSDLSNVIILDLFYRPMFSLDVWKNAAQFWFNHNKKLDFVEFYIDFFDKLSAKIFLENPIKHKKDFIFDGKLFLDKSRKFPDYDWLVVNSLPLSEQFKSNIAELDEFCIKLSNKFSVITTRKISDIPCTTDYGMSMSDIATQSLNCKFHLMISTGPSWYVLNNINCKRSKGIFLLLDNEEVIFSDNMKVFRSVKEFEEFFINSKF